MTSHSPMTTSSSAGLSYFEDYSPGSGRRSPARAWLHSDAPRLDLNGEWRFKLWPSAAAADQAVAAPDFDDSGWDLLPVPSHWVLQGDGKYGNPAYTNVQFPFPIDPPRVPDENPTGDHRRSFTLPDWDVERYLLRFDGVESTYRIWLNGQEIGIGKGSRLAQEFDVTQALQPGQNVLVVRVHQWSSMSYLEDQDQWWLPGIFRDVTLLGRPAGGIDDLGLRTSYDHLTGAGTLQPEIVAAPAAYPITLTVPELDLSIQYDAADELAAIDLDQVQPWSAESPRLYDVVVSSATETITQRVGFRTVAIKGDIFAVNGRQVIFHGMNRHETHPERGRVFDAEHARADLIMMKQHNVNAVRTSHYPPHPQVLDLCDELGFWVIDECDLETHGFGKQGWVDNPSDDSRWEAAYLDRIERAVERDKNHACIVIWSLGNESGTGRNLAKMSQWVHRRDPGRPVHYEGDYQGAYTDVYSRMYPSLEETAAIGEQTGELLGNNAGTGARVRTRPFLLCEYAHAMGNGPGALKEYDELFDAYPRLHGGFVWEWRDHGLLTHTAEGISFYGYGGDFGEVVHDGNFVMDGMVLPDDTPTPGLAEFAAVSAPIQLSLAGDQLTVRNRHHDLSTDHLRFVATNELAGRSPETTTLEVPSVAAGESIQLQLPAEVIRSRGADSWLTIVAELAEDTIWAPAGHPIATTQFELAAPEQAAQAWPRFARADRRPDQESHQIGPAEFDTRTGRLTSLYGLPVDGPRLELWRGPTDNDRGNGRGSYELGDPALTAGRGVPGPSSERRWRERGIDRLVHRVDDIFVAENAFTCQIRVGTANSAMIVDVSYRWRFDPDSEELWFAMDAVPSPDWDCTWPRIGVRIDLPKDVDRAEWFGTGPAESYNDSKAAARVGRFAADIDELNTRYSRPQETGHRPDLRELRLAQGDRAALQLRTVPDTAGHRPGFSLSRHTPQQLDLAGHPHELPVNDQVYLFLDSAQHGLGTRSCGMDVQPKYALWPGQHAFAVVFSPAD